MMNNYEKEMKDFFNGLPSHELVNLKAKYDKERSNLLSRKGGCTKCQKNALIRRYKSKIRKILERE